jgi:type IV fimbrial biogenesis protein FimT
MQRSRHLPSSGPLSQRRGLTLVETLIALTVTLTALATAMPGFQLARERRHVEGIAAQLETDLQFTRALAVAHNRNLRFEIGASAHGACYMVHTGSAGDCLCERADATCSPGVTLLRSAHIEAEGGVTLGANVRSMVFDAEKGTVTPTATLRVQSVRGIEIRQIINIFGRVRSCTPGEPLPGMRAC